MASFTMVAQSATENVAAVVSFSLGRLSGEVKMVRIRDNQIISQSGKILKTLSLSLQNIDDTFAPVRQFQF